MHRGDKLRIIAKLGLSARISVPLRDTGLFNHVCPFGDVRFQARGHFVGRAAAHDQSQRLRLLLHARHRQNVVDGLGARMDYRLWGFGWGRNPVPTDDFLPVTLLKSSAARCCVLPGLRAPRLSLPGLAHAAFTRSFSGEFTRVRISGSNNLKHPLHWLALQVVRFRPHRFVRVCVCREKRCSQRAGNGVEHAFLELPGLRKRKRVRKDCEIGLGPRGCVVASSMR